jgi:pyrophosphatase PpaX
MAMRSEIRAILFDWDGTLADTAEASFRCYVRMFADFGIPFDRRRYAETYSPNWYHTFRCVGLEKTHWSVADEKWLSYFAEEQVQLVPDAISTLEDLAARNLPAGIVTSGSRPRIERELLAHQVAHRFHTVVCGTDIVEKKPHPEALLLCLDRMGVTAENAAYIGDSPEDVLMARAAKVRAVAVRGAYPNVAALEAAGPDLIVGSVSEAIGALL